MKRENEIVCGLDKTIVGATGAINDAYIGIKAGRVGAIVGAIVGTIVGRIIGLLKGNKIGSEIDEK